jgi:hypothetical protein
MLEMQNKDAGVLQITGKLMLSPWATAHTLYSTANVRGQSVDVRWIPWVLRMRTSTTSRHRRHLANRCKQSNSDEDAFHYGPTVLNKDIRRPADFQDSYLGPSGWSALHSLNSEPIVLFPRSACANCRGAVLEGGDVSINSTRCSMCGTGELAEEPFLKTHGKSCPRQKSIRVAVKADASSSVHG